MLASIMLRYLNKINPVWTQKTQRCCGSFSVCYVHKNQLLNWIFLVTICNDTRCPNPMVIFLIGWQIISARHQRRTGWPQLKPHEREYITSRNEHAGRPHTILTAMTDSCTGIWSSSLSKKAPKKNACSAYTNSPQFNFSKKSCVAAAFADIGINYKTTFCDDKTQISKTLRALPSLRVSCDPAKRFNEAFRGLWAIYGESLQWQSAASVAAVQQLKSQITLNQHHLQAQVNLRANNDERNLFRQLSSW